MVSMVRLVLAAVAALFLPDMAAPEPRTAQPSPALASRRWRQCVADGGFTAKGHWMPSQNSTPGAPPDRSGACASVKHWAWQPAEEACMFRPLSARAFFEAAGAAGFQRLLLVGDSLMRQFYNDLDKLRDTRKRDIYHKKRLRPAMWSEEDQARASALAEGLLSTTLLFESFMGEHKPRHMARRPAVRGEAAPTAYDNGTSAVTARVAKAINRTKPDLLVINFGAHYNHLFDRSTVREVYRNHSVRRAEAVRRAVGSLEAPPLVLWRSTGMAHPGCGNAPPRPMTENEDPRESGSWAAFNNSIEVTAFNWDLFVEYNSDAADIWRSAFVGYPRFAIMDTAELTRLRRDLHLDPKTREAALIQMADPESHSHYRDDCLHYNRPPCGRDLDASSKKEPTEMGLWWASLLYNIIDSAALVTT